MEQNPFADGPWGNCTCGWPRFRDGSCSNGECPDGGLVLDPFVGTGTTVLAAIQAGRRGIGIELNPKYVDLANQRLAAITPNMFLEAV